MRVLLVSSNLYSQFPAVFPNALGSLSAYLQQCGHEVAALHMARKGDRHRLPGLLQVFAPDIVGISVMTCETPIIGPVAREAKAWNPKVTVLVGGIHAIVSPESPFDVPEVDGVCAGEGELAFAEYLRLREAGQDGTTAPNFVFRKDGELQKNPSLPFIEDLNELPPMDRSVADLQEVIDGNNGVLNVIFSRGCPWNCSFCSNRHIRAAGSGKYARVMGVDESMAELQRLADNYRFTHVLFRDDTFTWNRDWAIEFVREYARRFDTPFDIFARVDCLDEELMDELAAAGCGHIFLGLDSGNDFIRNEVLNKEQSNEDLFRVTDYMKSIGIRPMISNIVGLPHETPEMFEDTLAINRRIHRDMVVFSPTCGACPKIWVFTPWPGSDLYGVCDAQGWIQAGPGTRKVYRESVLEMPGFSRREIERRFRTFRYQVYKENFPVQALLFLVYDSAAFQAFFERIPLGVIGGVREGILTAMVRERRRAFLSSMGRRLLGRASTG